MKERILVIDTIWVLFLKYVNGHAKKPHSLAEGLHSQTAGSTLCPAIQAAVPRYTRL